MQQSKQIKSDSVDPFTAMLATQNFRRSGSFSILDAQGLDYKQTGGQIPTPNCDKKVSDPRILYPFHDGSNEIFRASGSAPAETLGRESQQAFCQYSQARNILPITPGIHNEGSFLRQTYRVASDPGFGNSARTVLSDIIETPNADMRSASEASSHWQSSIKCKFYDPNYHGAPGNCGFKKPDEKDLWRWPSEKTLVSGDTSGMGSAYHGACPQFFPVPQYSKIEGVNTGVQHCMQPSFQRSFNSTPSVDNITNTLRPNQVHSSKPWPLDYSSHLHCNRNNGGYCNSFDQQSQEQMRFLAFSQNFGISSANLSAPSNLPWIEAPGYVLPEAAQDPTDLFFLQTQLKRPSSQAFVPNPQILSAAFGGNAQTSGFQQFANASPMTSLPTTQRALSAPTSSSEYYGPWHRKTTSQVIAENAGFNPFAAGPYTSMTTAVLVMHEQEREAQSHDRALFLAGGPNLPQALPDFSRFVWIVVLQMLGLADSSGHVRNEGSWTANAREELVVFVENVLQATDVSRTMVLLGLKYINILCKQPQYRFEPGSEKNLITFGFMLANKILDDHTFTNRTWSDVTKIPLEELNRYEICFMNLLNHNKFIVSRDEFLSWILALQNHFVQLTGNGGQQQHPLYIPKQSYSHTPQNNFTNQTDSKSDVGQSSQQPDTQSLRLKFSGRNQDIYCKTRKDPRHNPNFGGLYTTDYLDQQPAPPHQVQQKSSNLRTTAYGTAYSAGAGPTFMPSQQHANFSRLQHQSAKQKQQNHAGNYFVHPCEKMGNTETELMGIQTSRNNSCQKQVDSAGIESSSGFDQDTASDATISAPATPQQRQKVTIIGDSGNGGLVIGMPQSNAVIHPAMCRCLQCCHQNHQLQHLQQRSHPAFRTFSTSDYH